METRNRDTARLKKLIDKNPSVNHRQLSETLEVIEELRAAGVTETRYRFDPPFSGQTDLTRPLTRYRIGKKP